MSGPTRTQTLVRYNPYSRPSVPQTSMAMVPYAPRTLATIPMNDYVGRGRISRYNNSIPRPISRRRNKFSVISTRTNPVYPRPEVKYVDFPAPLASIPNTNFIQATINQIAPGTGPSQRIGSQVAIKSVYYQYFLQIAMAPTTCVRYILYWDRQPNGAAIGLGDILAQTPYLTAPLNLDNRDRFVILADERTSLSPQGEQCRMISGFRNINQLSTYVGGNNIPQTGALGYLFVSDETNTDPNPSYFGTWRCRYMDN